MERITERDELCNAILKDPGTSEQELIERICDFEEAAVWHDFDNELPAAYHEPYLVWARTAEGEEYLDVDVWNECTDDYGESCGFFECYGDSPDTVLYWREAPEVPEWGKTVLHNRTPNTTRFGVLEGGLEK